MLKQNEHKLKINTSRYTKKQNKLTKLIDDNSNIFWDLYALPQVTSSFSAREVGCLPSLEELAFFRGLLYARPSWSFTYSIAFHLHTPLWARNR